MNRTLELFVVSGVRVLGCFTTVDAVWLGYCSAGGGKFVPSL